MYVSADVTPQRKKLNMIFVLLCSLLHSGQGGLVCFPELGDDIALMEALMDRNLACCAVGLFQLELQHKQEQMSVLATKVEEIQQLEEDSSVLDTSSRQLMVQLRSEWQEQRELAQAFAEVNSGSKGASHAETEAGRELELVLEQRWKQHQEGWQQQDVERDQLQRQRLRLMRLHQSLRLHEVEERLHRPAAAAEGREAGEDHGQQEGPVLDQGHQQRQEQGAEEVAAGGAEGGQQEEKS